MEAVEVIINWKKYSFEKPKLVYTLTVLPNPSQEINAKLKAKCFKFLWDEQPDTNARKRIKQCKYANCDLKCFILINS